MLITALWVFFARQKCLPFVILISASSFELQILKKFLTFLSRSAPAPERMASSSASLTDSGFPPAGLVKDKVGGGGGIKFGGGGGVKGGGGGMNAGGVGRLWLALASSEFLNCSSSAAADDFVWKTHQRVRNVYRIVQ